MTAVPNHNLYHISITFTATRHFSTHFNAFAYVFNILSHIFTKQQCCRHCLCSQMLKSLFNSWLPCAKRVSKSNSSGKIVLSTQCRFSICLAAFNITKSSNLGSSWVLALKILDTSSSISAKWNCWLPVVIRIFVTYWVLLNCLKNQSTEKGLGVHPKKTTRSQY